MTRDRLVWDSDRGDMRRGPEPGQRRDSGRGARAPRGGGSGGSGGSGQPGPARPDGVVRIRRETGGRGGKTVTTISGVPGHPDAVAELARELKALCGTGGAVKDGVIELQGDQRERVEAFLRGRGFDVKRAGG